MVHETKDTKLISGAAPHFEAHPGLKEVFVSSDGQYFHTVSASNYHCKSKGLKLYRVTRAQMPKAAKVEPPKQPAAEPTKPAAEPAKPEIDETPKTVPPPKNKGGRPPGSKAKSTTTKKT